MLTEHEIEIRVRYCETDAQGVVHHATYFNYFELGRCEQLRASGRPYETLEAEGVNLVVAEISARYHRPCRFGDLITLRTRTLAAKGARIHHEYQIRRGEELLVEGKSTLACIDVNGRVRRLPDWMVEEGERIGE